MKESPLVLGMMSSFSFRSHFASSSFPPPPITPFFFDFTYLSSPSLYEFPICFFLV